MNRKLTLILALIILVAVSVSIATAVNDTQEELTADDSSDDTIAVEDAGDVQSSQNTGKLGDGGLTIEKVWKDDNDKAGKRPSSIKFAILVDGKEAETGEIRQNMSWKATIDLAILQDSTYEVVEKDVPDGYEANVTGSVREGFVITNTLKDTPKNDTPKNDTSKNATDKKDLDSEKPSYNGSKQVTKISTKTTTKETPVEKAKNDTNDTNATEEPYYLYDTGNPILIGVIAVALAGIAYALYRRGK
jgi:hypothetical protein